MKFLNFKNKNEGFSMVELMIVVGIISVMTSIAIPQYYRLTEKAIATEGIILMNALEKEIITFYAFNDYYPDFGDIGDGFLASNGGGGSQGGGGGFFAQGTGGGFIAAAAPPQQQGSLAIPTGPPGLIWGDLIAVFENYDDTGNLPADSPSNKTINLDGGGTSPWYAQINLTPGDPTLRLDTGFGVFPINALRHKNKFVRMFINIKGANGYRLSEIPTHPTE